MKKVIMTCSKTASCCFSIALALVLVVGFVAPATAQTETVYNSIPKPLPGNVASEGPEAYAFSELGDGLNLVAEPEGSTFSEVTVILSSWACQSGNWSTNNCVTHPGATFKQPITVNIYGVDNTGIAPDSSVPLATITQTFTLPYRPSSDPVNCDPQTWFSKKDKTCYHGIAVPVSVDFSSFHLPLQPNNKVIVTVAFNTTHYGPSPIGESASCYTSSGGCPYDSLNISTDSNGGNYQVIGSVLDPNGIFVNYTLPNNSCTGTASPGLKLDTPCWAGYHPMIQVEANTKGKHHKKGKEA